ncbi:hypothetical protein K474DRAFT_1711191 [Panus rudis PR-1116 ss-1]|nr:hypothetical protein K474DRAFT_1711191 [Panus rudis PR-1116 ss-1]
MRLSLSLLAAVSVILPTLAVPLSRSELLARDLLSFPQPESEFHPLRPNVIHRRELLEARTDELINELVKRKGFNPLSIVGDLLGIGGGGGDSQPTTVIKLPPNPVVTLH